MARLPIESSTATSVVMHGRELLSFGGCSYLGLSHEPRVHAALQRQMSISGISTTASRETTGNTTTHERLEEDLGMFLGMPATFLLTEGYTANFAMAQGIASRGLRPILDARSHRSIEHACAGAGLSVDRYPHLDASAASACVRRAGGPVAIITDGVFAADGSVAPADDLLGLLPDDDRSLLVIDDCHGVGVMGDRGRGTADHFGVGKDPRVVLTGTLGKGLGCYGGFVAGTRVIVEAFRDAAGIFKGTTPVPTPLAAAAREALRLTREEPTLVARLHANIARMTDWFTRAGLPTNPIPTPIFTFWLDEPGAMEQRSEEFLRRGMLVPLIDYPNGPRERYFRISVTAAHDQAQIDRFGETLVALFADARAGAGA